VKTGETVGPTPSSMPPGPVQPIYSGRLPVLRWYHLYCAGMALLYLACVVGGAVLVIFRDRLADAENPAAFFLVYGSVLIASGAVFAGVYLAAFFLPRRPWTWIYHIVLIGIGLTSPCTMAAAVPLLIAWIRPETRAWFGRD
jgi:hypothetical protein